MSEDAGNIVKVEMFEDYSLSFDWSTFLVRICHKQQLNDDNIHAGDIFSLVARKKPHHGSDVGKNAIGKNAIGKIAIGKNAIGENARW